MTLANNRLEIPAVAQGLVWDLATEITARRRQRIAALRPEERGWRLQPGDGGDPAVVSSFAMLRELDIEFAARARLGHRTFNSHEGAVRKPRNPGRSGMHPLNQPSARHGNWISGAIRERLPACEKVGFCAVPLGGGGGGGHAMLRLVAPCPHCSPRRGGRGAASPPRGAMARYAPNQRLGALLTEADWSAGELARAVNALGVAQRLSLRYDRTSVAHWLVGSRPLPPVPDLVAAALSRRIGRVISTEETGLFRPSKSQAALSSYLLREADPVKRLVTLARSDVDPASRAFRTRSVYSPAAVTLPTWAPDLQLSLAPAGAKRRPATPADAQLLQDMIKVFAGVSARHGGAHARSALAAYLADDTSRLLASPAPSLLYRELLVGAAQLTHLLATMTTAAGHHGLAQDYFRTALGLAYEAGDRTTYAITLRMMSVQALRLDQRRHAADLADAAVETAGARANPAAKAFVLIQRALMRAHDGQHRRALADLTAAEAHHARASSPPGPFTAYPQAGLDYQRAETFLALGERAEALAALQDSARHRSPGQRQAFALTHARLAETCLDIGHVEAACGHWRHFLTYYPHLRSARVDDALAQLQQDLRPYSRHPHAAALLDRARALTKPPLRAN